MKYSALTIIAAALLVVGCAPFRYSQFTGHQSWPTGSEAMSDKGYAVPVYRGWPEKPYTVIGSIQFANPNPEWDDGDTARAARFAKKKKGNAIIMRQGAEAGVGAIVGAAADPKIVSISQVAALVIKWKPESEIAAEQAAIQSFAADFKAKHPDLALRPAVLALGVEMINHQGLQLSSDSTKTRLDDILTQVLRCDGDGKCAKWLFKGSLRSSAITSSYTQAAYGLATVTQSGNSITIVSEPGGTGVQLSGSVTEGHLAGQMGVTSGGAIYAGKAEGVYSADQISVTSQAQTADGLMQASFQFLH